MRDKTNLITSIAFDDNHGILISFFTAVAVTLTIDVPENKLVLRPGQTHVIHVTVTGVSYINIDLKSSTYSNFKHFSITGWQCCLV